MAASAQEGTRVFIAHCKDQKTSNVCPAGIDIAYHRLWKGDSHTYGHTRNTSIF